MWQADLDVGTKIYWVNGANSKTNTKLGGGHVGHTSEECQSLAHTI